jgi:excisionase family DNA binding protein
MPNINQELPRLLKTQEVCDYLNMSKVGIYQWVKKGKLKPIGRIGDVGRGGWRFRLEDVNKAANILEVEESPFE